ncbi:MAG: S-adenosylmethionine:tRNA ribosyltransferase-isomerase, partial [Anaerolineaceae bacterium]|nr:S-adenosylmethionine:tRNA ribosyltransferase-isomerase [Anaerolineaceae bacterium]
MNLQQFDYQLPPELIAQTPAEPRDASRLMVIRRQTGEISHHTFSDVLDFFDPGDILIANDSRVIPARLFGRKSTGGKAEILLLKPINALRWEALVGGKRLIPGTLVNIDSPSISHL